MRRWEINFSVLDFFGRSVETQSWTSSPCKNVLLRCARASSRPPHDETEWNISDRRKTSKKRFRVLIVIKMCLWGILCERRGVKRMKENIGWKMVGVTGQKRERRFTRHTLSDTQHNKWEGSSLEGGADSKTAAGEESLSKALDLKLLPSHRNVENWTGTSTFCAWRQLERVQR